MHQSPLIPKITYSAVVYSWFCFFFIEFLTIVLLCNDCLCINSLPLLLVSAFSFLCGVRSNILTSIILVSKEQLCQWRGGPRHYCSCVTLFFPKNSPQIIDYHHDEDILTTTHLWKQQRNNETSTILRWTALYLMLFRLVFTAIATPLRPETYHAFHHRYNFHIASRYIASYTFPLSMSSNSALLLWKQTIYRAIEGLLLASNPNIKCSPTTTKEWSCYHHKQTTSTHSSWALPCRHEEQTS